MAYLIAGSLTEVKVFAWFFSFFIYNIFLLAVYTRSYCQCNQMARACTPNGAFLVYTYYYVYRSNIIPTNLYLRTCWLCYNMWTCRMLFYYFWPKKNSTPWLFRFVCIRTVWIYNFKKYDMWVLFHLFRILGTYIVYTR